jgi:UDPglucose 6-dehydrogenase
MNISVFGLGKVGLSLAACLVRGGHTVVGADVDPTLVEALNRRDFRTPEPGVVERLSQAPAGHLVATTNAEQAVCETDCSFVIVPTPSNTLGGFSLRYVLPACDHIGAAIQKKSSRHTVVITSTLLPGSSDSIVIPRLEQASGKKVGEGFFYCYNPSFIALGEVVKGIECPDYLLIGESTRSAGDVVLSIHRSIVAGNCPIARMAPVEAEITKIASNTHETMRVSFANMLLSICSEVPGADVDRITEALAHRMGRRFFKGAVPYGGPCWPRDNQAFSVFMDAMRTPSTLPRAVDTFNEEHGRYVLRKILAISNVGDSVGILGLAYKPGTPVIDRSFAVDLARWLVREGRRVIGWDPLAIDEVKRTLGSTIEYADHGDACLSADIVVVANVLPELTRLDWAAAKNAVVVDCWRCLPAEAVACLVRYTPLGRGPETDLVSWLEKTAGDTLRLLTS